MVRRGRKLSPCAGGERGAFAAGGRALCGGVVPVDVVGRLTESMGA